jgi:hypothetical protein
MIVSLDLQSQKRIGSNRINQRSDRSIATVGERVNVRSRPSSRYTLSSPCWQPQSLYRPTRLDLPLEIRSEHLRNATLRHLPSLRFTPCRHWARYLCLNKRFIFTTIESLNRTEVWDVRNSLFLTVFSDGRSRIRPRRAGLDVRDPPVGRLASSESHIVCRGDLFRGNSMV